MLGRLLLLLCLQSAVTQEPCKIINVKSNLIRKGIVNVIYLMDHTCDTCYYEAGLLSSLQSQMMAREIIINPLIGVNSKPEKVTALIRGISVDSGKIWTALGQHNSHVFIIDKCNRLTYEVIMPWSKFKLPFVKAAILSTYYSEPCGACPSLQKKDKKRAKIIKYPRIKERTSLDNVLVSEDSDTLPMRIIFKEQHKHHGSHKIYDHIEKLVGDPSYHYHPEEEQEYLFGIQQITKEDDNGFNNFEITDSNEEVSISLESESYIQNSSYEPMNKEKLWLHYLNILLWLIRV